MRGSLLLAVCCVVTATGCATTGSFTDTGFVGANHAYTVAYLDASARRLVPPDWILENFTEDSRGRPDVMKTEGAYTAKVDWTWDDGSSSKVRFVIHDLRFGHRNSDGNLWVRALPIPPDLEHKSLKVLAERWVNNLNGTVYEFTFGASVEAKRVATKLLESKASVVSTRPAHTVVFDLVNLDQLQLDANAPRTRVRAIFVAAPLRKKLCAADALACGNFPDAPAVLFVGFSVNAEAFDAQVPRFDAFVEQISIQPDR
jgi:hypothetical protein